MFAATSFYRGCLTRWAQLFPMIWILLLLAILPEVHHAQSVPEWQQIPEVHHVQPAPSAQPFHASPQDTLTEPTGDPTGEPTPDPSTADPSTADPSNTDPSTVDPEYIRIETKNGNLFFGVLISEDEQTVTINIEGVGEITIRRTVIKTIERLSKDRFRDGAYWFENPQATRYFFAPNALSLEKKQGYYQNIWILFNNVNYGLTERFSIGGGMIPLFLFGAESSPVWILPKVTFPIQDGQFHVGAGAMLGGLVGEDTESLGLLYGVGTYGDRDRNMTLGIGYGYAGEDISTSPLVNLSGMWRTGPRVTLLTENYFIPEADMAGLLSIGARRTYERFAVDFGLVKPLGEDTDEVIAIPWLGVTMPFGRP